MNWIEELDPQLKLRWTGKVDQLISSERERLTSSFHLNGKGWPVQIKWTGQPFQFRWNELVNLSRSNERELFEQFQFNELKWNCHIPNFDQGHPYLSTFGIVYKYWKELSHISRESFYNNISNFSAYTSNTSLRLAWRSTQSNIFIIYHFLLNSVLRTTVGKTRAS